MGRSFREGSIVSPALHSELGGQDQVLPRISPEDIPQSYRRHRPHHTRLEQSLVLRSLHGRVASGSVQPWCLSHTKRIFDILGASIILFLSTPILLITAIAIKLETPGPILFRQWRTGFAGERFMMYKFRTMRRNADLLKDSLRSLNHYGPSSPDFKIRKDPRVTAVGKVLRRLSLDELPNLFNVLQGQMSLVGPRPTSFDIDAYQVRHVVMLTVRPGLTGLWQISGRGDVDFERRVQLDSRYIENQSPLLDLRILLLTPIRVLRGRGAY